MLDFDRTCKWCEVPIHIYSENPFVMFCLDNYEGEKFTRSYLRKRGRRNWDEVCLRCKDLKLPNIRDRELGKIVKLPPLIDSYDHFFEIIDMVTDQDTFHRLYIEFMKIHDYTFLPFCDCLAFREFLNGKDDEWVYEDDIVLFYYENMVRFHLNSPYTKYDCVWDEDNNIVGFTLTSSEV